MASSYPTPFEGTGEVKEGFLCPLCLKDLQSFYQLQDHYEEEHSGDDGHVRGQLKSEWRWPSSAHSAVRPRTGERKTRGCVLILCVCAQVWFRRR